MQEVRLPPVLYAHDLEDKGRRAAAPCVSQLRMGMQNDGAGGWTLSVQGFGAWAEDEEKIGLVIVFTHFHCDS